MPRSPGASSPALAEVRKRFQEELAGYQRGGEPGTARNPDAQDFAQNYEFRVPRAEEVSEEGRIVDVAQLK